MKNVILAVAALSGTIAEADTVHAVRTPAPFVLDGDYEEAVYCGYDWSAPFRVLDCESATVNGLYAQVEDVYRELKTVTGMFYDGDRLYAAFIAPASAKTPVGDGDSVGVALSRDGKTQLVVEVSAKKVVSVFRIDANGVRTDVADHGVTAGVKTSARSLGVEIAIPFALIGANPSQTGATWACNLFRKGPSCGGQASWSAVTPQGGILELENYGEVVISGKKSVGAPLAENVDKVAFLWEGSRWGNGDADIAVPLDGKELTKVSLSGPRGARAMAHFRVSNLTGKPEIYTIKVDGFDKNPFAEKLRFRELGYLELKGGPIIPDPVFDLPNGSILRIPPKSTAVVWVDVDPKGLKPGVHTAKAKLVPGYSLGRPKMVAKELTVELTLGKADVSEIDIPCWAYALRGDWQFRELADYGFNVNCMLPVTFGGTKRKDGTRDFTAFDRDVQAMIDAGIPQERVRILCYHMFPMWCNKFGTPEFEAGIVEMLRAGIVHARERWGIGTDRLMFSSRDEPHGNPDEEKSAAWYAFYGTRLAKRADPKLRNFTNPYKLEKAYLDAYIREYDVLEPFVPPLDADEDIKAKFRTSGREIWNYTILLKQNTPAQYRRASWLNAANGFEGPSAFYDLSDCAGDQLDSYDRNGGPDYNAAYRDPRTRRMLPSRRMEAWYLGHVEQKLAIWCRRKLAAQKAVGKDVTVQEARFKAILEKGLEKRADFDAARVALLTLSEEL